MEAFTDPMNKKPKPQPPIVARCIGCKGARPDQMYCGLCCHAICKKCLQGDSDEPLTSCPICGTPGKGKSLFCLQDLTPSDIMQADMSCVSPTRIGRYVDWFIFWYQVFVSNQDTQLLTKTLLVCNALLVLRLNDIADPRAKDVADMLLKTDTLNTVLAYWHDVRDCTSSFSATLLFWMYVNSGRAAEAMAVAKYISIHFNPSTELAQQISTDCNPSLSLPTNAKLLAPDTLLLDGDDANYVVANYVVDTIICMIDDMKPLYCQQDRIRIVQVAEDVVMCGDNKPDKPFHFTLIVYDSTSAKSAKMFSKYLSATKGRQTDSVAPVASTVIYPIWTNGKGQEGRIALPSGSCIVVCQNGHIIYQPIPLQLNLKHIPQSDRLLICVVTSNKEYKLYAAVEGSCEFVDDKTLTSLAHSLGLELYVSDQTIRSGTTYHFSVCSRNFEAVIDEKRTTPKLGRFVILSGLPGCGKSTLSNSLSQYDYTIISQDIQGSRHACEALIKRTLQTSPDAKIVVDRCNPTPEDRKIWVDLLSQYRKTGDQISSVFFVPQARLCRLRVCARFDHPTIGFGTSGRVVFFMKNKLTRPTLAEGFNSLFVVERIDELMGFKFIKEP